MSCSSGFILIEILWSSLCAIVRQAIPQRGWSNGLKQLNPIPPYPTIFLHMSPYFSIPSTSEWISNGFPDPDPLSALGRPVTRWSPGPSRCATCWSRSNSTWYGSGGFPWSFGTPQVTRWARWGTVRNHWVNVLRISSSVVAKSSKPLHHLHICIICIICIICRNPNMFSERGILNPTPSWDFGRIGSTPQESSDLTPSKVKLRRMLGLPDFMSEQTGASLTYLIWFCSCGRLSDLKQTNWIWGK